MAEYLLLATFVAVLSGATVWTVRTFQKVGRAFYRALLPSSRGNIKKPISLMEELPVLSDTLDSIPMPWGWYPLRIPAPQKSPIMMPRQPVVVPWGWPGYRRRTWRYEGTRRAIAVRLNGFRAVHARNAPTDGEPDTQDGRALGIRGNLSGGFYLVDAGKVPVSDARVPWGW